ncbi:MAG: TonB-dependent receptor [Bacteroidales bacterium]
MAKWLILGVLCLALGWLQVAFPQENAGKTYALFVERKPLAEVIPLVEKASGFSIAFSPSIIDPSSPISCRVNTRQLSSFLNTVFLKNGIDWVLIGNQIVLQKIRAEVKKTRWKIIHGTVKDARSGELLAATKISAEGWASVYTNSYGFFSLQIPEQVKKLEFFHPGHKPVEIAIDQLSSLPVVILLEPMVVEMQPVVISGEKNLPGYWESGMGGFLMSQMNHRGNTGDVITTLGTIPGFSLFGDGSTRFFVRGGESSQNLILIDESPVFNPSHLFGFISSLDASVIREIKAYKCDAPAEYGNRLSGVLDIHTREGNLNRWAGELTLSPFYSSVISELPLLKEKAGMMLSARRSNLEWLRLSAFTPYNFTFNFYDVHWKMNAWITPKNRIYATLYASSDQYSAVSESVFKNYGLGWGNLITSLRWNWLASPRVFINTFFNSSRYTYKLYLNSRHTDYWNSEVTWYALHSNLSWFFSSEHILRAGVGLENYLSVPGRVIMGTGATPTFYRHVNDFRSLSGFIYAGLESHLMDGRLQLQPGVRLTWWGNYGPQIVPYFNSDFQVFATDTIADRRFYFSHLGLEPRFRMVFKSTERLQFMASASVTRQYFQPLSNTVSPFTTLETFIPSGPNLRPQSSYLLSTGLSYTAVDNAWQLSAEAYYRKLDGQIDYRDHAGLLYAPFPEGELRQGEARAAGVEFRLAKMQGHWNGWLTYTYSRTTRNTSGINGGRDYFPYFDRPHQAMLMFSWNPTYKFSTGAAWYLSSGGMTTLPVGFYQENGIPVPVYGDRYNARLPLYHRLDLFAAYQWITSKPSIRYELSLNIRNAYGRHNPFIYGFNKIMDDAGNFRVPTDLSSSASIVPTRLSVNGIIPSISLKVSLE